MRPEDRVVVSRPLTELWNERGVVPAVRVGQLTPDALVTLLQNGATFVVADLRLTWVPAAERFTFWKKEVKPRLVTTEMFRLEDFPGEYCYAASPWDRPDGTSIILLEMHH